MSLIKKYSKQALTVFLTLGAIVLLGLLSFSGMYVLLPLLSISIAAFVLSVIYEGEIYHKNISNALDKLLNRNFTAHLLGEMFLDEFDFTKISAPAFFKTYKKLRSLPASPERDKRLETMKTWLGKLLMGSLDDTPYQKEVVEFISSRYNEDYQLKAQEVSTYHSYIKIFSAVAAGLMALGTIFLILEALPALPFIIIAPAVLPYIVIPMASLAGIAYGFLSYNALTDFLLKNKFKDWWENIIKQATHADRGFKHIFFVGFSILIFALNLTLTLCTAGTWWTVVNSAQTTWRWLKYPLIKVATTLIAPVVSVATLGFNLENTIETINQVNEAPDKKKPAERKKNTETWLQMFNPFRILLKLTFTPLLLVLFLGHLISIGLTSDRMPGIPAIISALLGIISEGFEDFHYFFNLKALIKPFAITFKIISSPFQAIGYLVKSCWQHLTRAVEKPDCREILSTLGHFFSDSFNDAFATTEEETASCSTSAHQHANNGEHHHEHSALPNKILELAFSPLFLLAAFWHWGCQNWSTNDTKTFWQCVYLQFGWTIENPAAMALNVEAATEGTWLRAESIFALREKIDTLDNGEKKNSLVQIYNAVKAPNATLDSIRASCTNDGKQALGVNRFFKVSEKTNSEILLEQVLNNEQNILKKAPNERNESLSWLNRNKVKHSFKEFMPV